MNRTLTKTLSWILTLSLLLSAAGAWAADETTPQQLDDATPTLQVDGSLTVTDVSDEIALDIHANTEHVEAKVSEDIEITEEAAGGDEVVAVKAFIDGDSETDVTAGGDISASTKGDENTAAAVVVNAFDTADVEIRSENGSISAQTEGGGSPAEAVAVAARDDAAVEVHADQGGISAETSGGLSTGTETADATAVNVTAYEEAAVTVSAGQEGISAETKGDEAAATAVQAEANGASSVTVTAGEDGISAKTEGDYPDAQATAVYALADGTASSDKPTVTVTASGDVSASSAGFNVDAIAADLIATEGGSVSLETSRAITAQTTREGSNATAANIHLTESGKADVKAAEISASTEEMGSGARGVNLVAEDGAVASVQADGISAETKGTNAATYGLVVQQVATDGEVTVQVGKEGVSAQAAGDYSGVTAAYALVHSDITLTSEGDITAKSTAEDPANVTALMGFLFDGGSLTVHVGGGIQAEADVEGWTNVQGVDIGLTGGMLDLDVTGDVKSTGTALEVDATQDYKESEMTEAEATEIRKRAEADNAYSFEYDETVDGVTKTVVRYYYTDPETGTSYSFSFYKDGGWRSGSKQEPQNVTNQASVHVGGSVVAEAEKGVRVQGVFLETENDASEITAKVDGEIRADGPKTANAANIEVQDGKITLRVGGDVTALSQEGNADALAALVTGEGEADIQIDGKVTATRTGGEADTGWARGVEALSGKEGGKVTVTVADGVSAENLANRTRATAITVRNHIDGETGNGGETDVRVTGDVESTGTGIHIRPWEQSERVWDTSVTPTVREEEYLRTEYWEDGASGAIESQKVYYNAEGDYYYSDNGMVWRLPEHTGTGSNRVEVKGDVTAGDAGVKVASVVRTDVIVDGTLEGKNSAVLLYEDTAADNFTLTVWEVKPDADGNIIERGWMNEKGEIDAASGEAEQALEKEIQYIIRLDPPEKGATLSTGGTYEYEGYTVAKEGDTVVLKVNLEPGYELVDAFNGTDTKVQLLRDANGEYYLVVPRGGAVLLSVTLRKKETASAPAATRNIPYVPATVTIDPNGGLLRGSAAPFTIAAAEGKWIDLPEAPTLEGKTFLGWYGTESPRTDSRWTAPEKDSPALKAAGARVMVPATIFYTAVWE